MGYCAADEFRAASVQWHTKGLTLTEEEADDDQLTAAIEAMSDQIDYETKDHFSPVPGGADPEGTTTLLVEGNGTSILRLPMRIREVTALATVSPMNEEITQSIDVYRAKRSLDSAGIDRTGDLDVIEIASGRWLANGLPFWEEGGRVKVTGRFGWKETPGQIKRACALMVYDSLKPRSLDLRRSLRWQNGDRAYEAPLNSTTGIPEADRILASYRRVD